MKKKKHLDQLINRGLKRRGSLRRSNKPSRRKRSWKQILGYVVAILLALFFAGVVSAAIVFAWLAKDLPDPDNIRFRQLPQTTKIFDRSGENILYEVHGDQKRTIVELDQMSPHVINATIAAEDKDFYNHKGFSIRGFARAMLKNLMRGDLRGEGGSTITQQFIKNSVLTTEKTYTRKLKELVLSVEMERRFTKDQILKLYLNEIPYGSVIYGIESASQSYFGKSANDLTLSEAAILASIPKATTYYSPLGSHRKELLQRSHFIIDSMVELGMVSQEEAEQAKEDDVLDKIKPNIDNIVAPHFVFYVREKLADQFGAQAESGGLQVYTTLDFSTQSIAETTVTDSLELINDWGGSTAALLALDPKTSEVLAMVGSPDYFDDENNGKFNHVFGYLQPGSSIKPIVYAAGFEKGYTPDTMLYDVETVFAKYPKEYKPTNYDGEEHGPVTVRQALAGSLNIPAVKMLYLVGLKNFAEVAQDFGYTTLSDTSRLGLSLVLGGGEVYPYEHISAFATFPQEGRYRPPKVILKVLDKDGNVLLDNTEPEPAEQIISVETARQINNILSDNAARAYVFGENNYLTLGDRPVAAKTGTTNKWKDAWTIGYTPTLLAGVWIGNSDGSLMKAGASSSKVAAPVWNAFMKEATKDMPKISFTEPEKVETGNPVLDGQASLAMEYEIDKMSGKLATENTPEDLIEKIEFSSPHSILHYIDKDDPRGEPPADPTADPQYQMWEEAIAAWAEKEKIVLRPPPTEYDDVHLPENIPSVSLTSPQTNATWSTRQVYLSVNAMASRGVSKVEYQLDGDTFTTFTSYPFGGSATLPNRYGKGFHQLTAVAYDDVGNRAESAAVTINLTAEAGPLGLTWITPNAYSRLYRYQFPLEIKIRLDDTKGITQLKLSAVSRSDQSEEVIGTVHNPPLPNLSFIWTQPSSSGSYELKAEATLVGGEKRSQTINVDVYGF